MDRYSDDSEKRFEATMEERPPRKGEWYMGVLRLPVLATKDFAIRSLPILKRVDDGPREQIELEREWLDAQAKADSKKATAEQPAEPPSPRRLYGEAPRHIKDVAKKIAREYRLPYTESGRGEEDGV